MENNLITVVEAEENNISMGMVRICREIRNLAKLDRMQLDVSVHRNGLNKHLFSYIEYCGVDPTEYIKSYLSNLQPYMIERFSSQEKEDSFICVLDNMYRVSLYIKIDKIVGKELIVSFHENNKRGIAKENNMIRSKQERLVPVFAEEKCSQIEGAEKQEIKILVQRGMLLVPIRLMGRKCENGTYIVNEQDIETPIIDQCNEYLRAMYTSDLDLEALDTVELFSVLHQISFTSYGNTVFSNISLLIDNIAIQHGVIGRKTADFALVTYVDHLLIDEEQAYELIALLREKYSVSSQKNIGVILDRIEDGLMAKIEVEEKVELPEFREQTINKPHRKRGR